MMLNRFLGKTVQTPDRQTMVHGPKAHGTHLVRACTMVCSDVECTVSNGIHGTLSQPKNLEMKANQRLDEV